MAITHVISILLIIMSAGMMACGILLWRRREETGDESRTIQAIFSWVSCLFSIIFISRTWNGASALYLSFLDPQQLFIPLLFQAAFFIYPLEILRPKWSFSKTFIFLFVPLLIIALVGIGSGIQYTDINSYSELFNHIHEFNVLFRLFALLIMLFYGFALVLVPYDYKNSSADRTFLLSYATFLFFLGILHIAIHISHEYILQIIHQVAWILFFYSITWYELKVRLFKKAKRKEAERSRESEKQDKLWESILSVLENDEEWRNPDIKLSTLSSMVYSNRTYVSEAFKRNTGVGFSEYISRRRIGHITTCLKENPDADINELFFYVGFRSYSTAWENFHRTTGMTVAEFISKLKDINMQKSRV